MKILLSILLATSALFAQSSGVGAGGTKVSKQICTAADAYTVLNGDQGMLLWSNDSNNCIVTLPQAGTSSTFMANWYADFKNLGTGVMTIVPTTSTCDGQVSCFIGIGGGIGVVSDGTNYETDGKSAPIVMFRSWTQTTTGGNCVSADGGSYNPLNSSGAGTCTDAHSADTAITVFTFTVPANLFATNHQLRIEETFLATVSSSPPNILVKLKAGGTDIYDSANTTLAGAAATNRSGGIVWLCSGTAALGSAVLECNAQPNGIFPGAVMTPSQIQGTVTTSGTLAFTTTVKFSANTPVGNWIMGRQITVTALPY
jgi:hypothetical protein